MLPTQSQASALVLATTGHPPAGSTCDRLVKLCSRFYKLLAALEGKENARGSAKVAKRARRESHLVPGLIFQVEDYEKQLVRLSKTGAWVGWSGG